MASMRVMVRLQAVLSALAPMDGVSVRTFGDAATVRLDFQDAATAQQRTAAAAALAAFDWSDAAEKTWEDQQDPDRAALRDNALQAIQTNQAFLNLSSATAAQSLAQVQALTQQMIQVIRHLADVL